MFDQFFETRCIIHGLTVASIANAIISNVDVGYRTVSKQTSVELDAVLDRRCIN